MAEALKLVLTFHFTSYFQQKKHITYTPVIHDLYVKIKRFISYLNELNFTYASHELNAYFPTSWSLHIH